MNQKRLAGILVMGMLGVLCLTWLPLLFSAKLAVLYRDLTFIFYPAKKYWADAVLNTGFPPLWDHSLLGGTPFFAECLYAPLSPFNLVFLLKKWLPFPLLFSWHLFLQHAVMAAGAYQLGKKITGEKVPALLLTFFWCTLGVTWSVLYMPHMLGTLAVFPWFLFFLPDAKKHTRVFFLGALVGAPVYLGDPQGTALFGLGAVWYFFLRQKPIQAATHSTLLALSSLLFSALQLLPTIQLAQGSARLGEGLPLKEILSWSFHPARFLEWFHPRSFEWQSAFTNGPDPGPFLVQTFYGAVPLVLTIAVLLYARPQKREWMTWIPALILLVASFGFYFPFSERLVGAAAKLAVFRYPERVLYLVMPLLLALTFTRWKILEARVPAKHVYALISLACAVHLVQFALASPRMFFTSPASYMDAPGMPEQMLKQKRSDEGLWSQGGARRFHSVDQGMVPRTEGFSAEEGFVRHDWRHWSQNLAGYFGVDAATGFHPLRPAWFPQFWEALSQKPDSLYSWLGIRYLARQDGEFAKLEINKSALPYVYVPQRLLGVDGREGAVSALREKLPDVKLAIVGNNRLSELSLPLDTQNQDEIRIKRGFGRISIGVAGNAAAGRRLLVWNETYNDNWRASVNSQEQSPIRANLWAMGVALPATAAGDLLEVEFRYHEPFLLPGILLLLLWIGLALFLNYGRVGSQ